MGRRPEVTRGFTLLELIVTLAVLAVAIAVVTPAIGRSTEGLRDRAEVAGFAATLRHAREQAITTQQTYRVVVDPEGHKMSVTHEAAPGQASGSSDPSRSNDPGRSSDPLRASNLSRVPGQSRLSDSSARRPEVETRSFSDRLVIEALQAPEVVFDTRGGTSGGDFKLTAGSGVYRVTVDRLTGRVRSTRE